MSAAVAETTITTEPSIDDLFAQAAEELTTRTSEPAAETPTPETAPVSEPKQDGEEASTDTPPTGRDANGRFAGAPPKESREGESAEAGKEPAEATPAAPDVTQTIAELQRQLAATRGNVDNAAKQAAAQTEARVRAEERAAAETRVREDTKQELQRQIHSGELTYDQANAIWTRKQGEWEQADREVQQQQHNVQRAGLTLSEVDVAAKNRLNTLYHKGAIALAEDTGLELDQVRDFFQPDDERERFYRASLQSDMAEKAPGAGFNRMALNDYMGTVVNSLKREAGIRKEYQGQLATLRKENEKLQQQLNRDEADTEALRGPEHPARGGGVRRKEPETMDEAYAELQRRQAQSPQLVRS